MVELFHVRQIDSALLNGERRRVLQRLKTLLPFATVVEVGSTAVDGVIGKEDVDFLVRVGPGRFREARDALDHHFERNVRQFADSEFQGYRIESPIDVSAHLTTKNRYYDLFEKFLIRLRADPALRKAYNDLKTAWDSRPMDEYRAAKSDFISAALALQQCSSWSDEPYADRERSGDQTKPRSC
jgi:GrpB-like predicted nucleotidyltransferase (UPF0157 family)